MVQQWCESWRLAIEYEKRLRAEQRSKGFYDPAIRQLRRSVREAYEGALFEDYAFAQANDVEQSLWKTCYYRPIEEFRVRIKEAAGIASGSAHRPGVTAEEAKEKLDKACVAYRQFLSDASLRYKALVARLQAAYGDIGVDLQLDPGTAAQVAAQVAATLSRMGTHGAQADQGIGLGAHHVAAGGGNGAAVPVPRDCRPSVHRCLIYLGDLSRYHSQARLQDAQEQAQLQADAVRWYQVAAHVVSSSGNPFNQLAVMAYLAQQELLSVYYYCRALGVSSPFATARENLLLLLESNRNRYGQLPPLTPSVGGAAQHVQQQLGARSVRLAGLLYDRVNLQALPEVRAACTAALRQALADPGFMSLQHRATSGPPAPGTQHASSGTDIRSGSMGHDGEGGGVLEGSLAMVAPNSPLLQVSVVLVFLTHSLSTSPDSMPSEASGCAAAAAAVDSSLARQQQPVLRRVALAALLEAAACLCLAICTPASPAPTPPAPAAVAAVAAPWSGMDVLLACLNVLLGWLASSSAEPLLPQPLVHHPPSRAGATGIAGAAPGVVGGTGGTAGGPSPARQSPLDEGGAAWAEVTARAAFWRAAARLARHLAGLLAGAGPALLHGALHDPPGEPLLAEELDMLGFVPLAECHALLPPPPPLLTRPYSRATSSRATATTTRPSRQSSSDLVSAPPQHTPAPQPNHHQLHTQQHQQHQQQQRGAGGTGDISGGSVDGLAAQQAQRAQRVLFWLHRASVRVAGVLSAAAGRQALSQAVSGVALQNLERAVGEFDAAMQEVAAQADTSLAAAAPTAELDLQGTPAAVHSLPSTVGAGTDNVTHGHGGGAAKSSGRNDVTATLRSVERVVGVAMPKPSGAQVGLPPLPSAHATHLPGTDGGGFAGPMRTSGGGGSDASMSSPLAPAPPPPPHTSTLFPPQQQHPLQQHPALAAQQQPLRQAQEEAAEHERDSATKSSRATVFPLQQQGQQQRQQQQQLPAALAQWLGDLGQLDGQAGDASGGRGGDAGPCGGMAVGGLGVPALPQVDELMMMRASVGAPVSQASMPSSRAMSRNPSAHALLHLGTAGSVGGTSGGGGSSASLPAMHATHSRRPSHQHAPMDPPHAAAAAAAHPPAHLPRGHHHAATAVGDAATPAGFRWGPSDHSVTLGSGGPGIANGGGSNTSSIAGTGPSPSPQLQPHTLATMALGHAPAAHGGHRPPPELLPLPLQLLPQLHAQQHRSHSGSGAPAKPRSPPPPPPPPALLSQHIAAAAAAPHELPMAASPQLGSASHLAKQPSPPPGQLPLPGLGVLLGAGGNQALHGGTGLAGSPVHPRSPQKQHQAPHLTASSAHHAHTLAAAHSILNSFSPAATSAPQHAQRAVQSELPSGEPGGSLSRQPSDPQEAVLRAASIAVQMLQQQQHLQEHWQQQPQQQVVGSSASSPAHRQHSAVGVPGRPLQLFFASTQPSVAVPTLGGNLTTADPSSLASGATSQDRQQHRPSETAQVHQPPQPPPLPPMSTAATAATTLAFTHQPPPQDDRGSAGSGRSHSHHGAASGAWPAHAPLPVPRHHQAFGQQHGGAGLGLGQLQHASAAAQQQQQQHPLLSAKQSVTTQGGPPLPGAGPGPGGSGDGTQADVPMPSSRLLLKASFTSGGPATSQSTSPSPPGAQPSEHLEALDMQPWVLVPQSSSSASWPQAPLQVAPPAGAPDLSITPLPRPGGAQHAPVGVSMSALAAAKAAAAAVAAQFKQQQQLAAPPLHFSQPAAHQQIPQQQQQEQPMLTYVPQGLPRGLDLGAGMNGGVAAGRGVYGGGGGFGAAGFTFLDSVLQQDGLDKEVVVEGQRTSGGCPPSQWQQQLPETLGI